MAQNMDKVLFKDLGEVPNARDSWIFVRDVVAAQLIGDDDVFPIPYIQDGVQYEIGDVILKEARSKKDRVLMQTPGAIHVGHLKGYLQPRTNAKKKEEILSNLSNYHEDKDKKFNPEYVFWEETMRKGTKKTIRVEVENCKKIYLENIPEENSLTVSFTDKGFDDLTKFYLITTIYVAPKIRIEVKINDQTDEYITKPPVSAIGFRLHGYKFDTLGVIGAPDEKSPKTWKVTFIPKSHFRGPMDRLPPLPFEEQNHEEDADGYLILPGRSNEARSR